MNAKTTSNTALSTDAVDADGDLARDLAALAKQYRRANGPLMTLVNKLGGKLEDQLNLIPKSLRGQIDATVTQALELAMSAASQGERLPDPGKHGTMAAAVIAGAAGGAGGMVTAVAELPLTVAVIMHAIRQEARAEGFDPETPEIRAECLAVFAAGSPLSRDDGVNTGFFSARLTVTGPAVHKVVATVAPKLAAAMGQKLAAQAIPVLGALSGAALNAAFLDYYRSLARIRFALLRLSNAYGEDRVLADFRLAIEKPKRIGRA